MNKVKMMLLTIFLVSFFVSNSYDIGVTVTQIDKTIWTIYQDKKSNYWFGSKENGVYYYNGHRLKHITTKNGLVSNEIRGIQEDANGNIFFDTEKGVSKFDGHTFKTLQMAYPDFPLNNWVLKPDDLWFRIGSTKNGAYRYDGKYLHYLKFPTSPQENTFYFGKENFKWMLIGLAFIIVGFVLMMGSDANTVDGKFDPNAWNDDIFSIRRIRIAPLFVVTGFVIEIYAILKRK